MHERRQGNLRGPGRRVQSPLAGSVGRVVACRGQDTISTARPARSASRLALVLAHATV